MEEDDDDDDGGGRMAEKNAKQREPSRDLSLPDMCVWVQVTVGVRGHPYPELVCVGHQVKAVTCFFSHLVHCKYFLTSFPVSASPS